MTINRYQTRACRWLTWTICTLQSPLSNAGNAHHVTHISCPAEIKASSVKLIDVPATWTPDIAGALRLNGAAPMAGAPSTKTYLSPYSSSNHGNILTDRFVFGPPDADGNWISCKYGRDNAVILAKRLDDGLTECSVSYTDRGHPGSIVNIVCQ